MLAELCAAFVFKNAAMLHTRRPRRLCGRQTSFTHHSAGGFVRMDCFLFLRWDGIVGMNETMLILRRLKSSTTRITLAEWLVVPCNRVARHLLRRLCTQTSLQRRSKDAYLFGRSLPFCPPKSCAALAFLVSEIQLLGISILIAFQGLSQLQTPVGLKLEAW